MATFLVTGAAGFIGSNIIQALLDQEHTVIGLDNFSSGKKENLAFTHIHPNKHHFSIIEGDIKNIQCCHNACKNVDYVLHHAASTSVPKSLTMPQEYYDNNITGTHNLLIAAKKASVKRFIYASSSAVYGNSPILPKNESLPPQPTSPYAYTKLINELHATMFWQCYGVPTIGLRYFNVYGPKQDPLSAYAAVIPNFIQALLSHQPVIIYGDGAQTRDFIYIDDIISANINACLQPLSEFGITLNICSGSPLSINTLLAQLNSLLNTNDKAQFKPPRKGDVQDSIGCPKQSQKVLQFSHKFPIMVGLSQTIRWYKDTIW